MMRSMLADQPYLEVTTTHGVLDKRVLIFTLSTSGSARAPFHHPTTPLNFSCTDSKTPHQPNSPCHCTDSEQLTSPEGGAVRQGADFLSGCLQYVRSQHLGLHLISM